MRRSHKPTVLFDQNTVPTYVVDISTLAFLHVNDIALRQYGYTQEEFLSLNVLDIRPPQEIPNLQEYLGRILARPTRPQNKLESAGIWLHRRKDGTLLRVGISWAFISYQGRDAILVYAQDVTQRRRNEASLAGQRRSLEQIAARSPSIKVLQTLLQSTEQEYFNLRCAFMVRDGKRPRLQVLLAPSLPSQIREALEGVELIPTSQCCGAANCSRNPVIVEDISSDPLWSAHQELVLQHGIRATWCHPISSSDGEAIGAFCVLVPEARGPSGMERTTLEDVARIAGIALERERQDEAIHTKTEQLGAIAEAMTRFLEEGNWQKSSARLLRAALNQTQSQHGFIGAVVDGPALRMLAYEGIVGNPEASPDFLEQAANVNQKEGFWEFTDMSNLLGCVMTTRKAVITNVPSTDPRSGGLPPGLPPLQCFLGVPILKGSEVVGMIGVANRPGGYHGDEQEKLEILTRAAGILYDSYRRHQHEAELEDQLRHTQKMEAIGRLAGGVAHDFNNMLTVITGFGQLLLERLISDDPLRALAHEILVAADRASTLTGQLLTFSRKQAAQPAILNLNLIVEQIRDMLERLIGENIELRLALESDSWSMKADGNHIEQVLLNLVVNARDAMPQGGLLLLETQNVTLSNRTASHGGLLEPGRYVVLAVTDTGCGIPAEAQAKIFEPFFTTKDVGKGTGLGLSTVYGLVNQNGGKIRVMSEAGKGTRFEIYFPWTDDDPDEHQYESKESKMEFLKGQGTIMLVEDEDRVRSIIHAVLTELGFTVLEADSSTKALRLSAEHPWPIHLVLTDVIMPGMNGAEMVGHLCATRPDMKVLYMSGYPEEVFQSILDPSTPLLQKPFSPSALARRVFQLLEQVSLR